MTRMAFDQRLDQLPAGRAGQVIQFHQETDKSSRANEWTVGGYLTACVTASTSGSRESLHPAVSNVPKAF